VIAQAAQAQSENGNRVKQPPPSSLCVGFVANRWGLNSWGATPISLVLHPLKRHPKEKSLTEENIASPAE